MDNSAGMTKRFTNPFPTLHINETAAAELESLAHVLVDKHVTLYEHFRSVEGGRVDDQRWKFVSELGDCRAYAERRHGAKAGTDFEIHVDTPQADLPVVLVTGTIAGDLDDTIYGYICPTIDMMRIKTAYVDDQLVGAHVLATIVKPTSQDPYRSVTVKWLEKGQRAAIRAIIKNRDFVYVESTGVEYLRNGERVGYQLIHSVHFPETPALDTLTRGALSMCAVYRQKDANSTEVFIKGFLNPAGGLMRSIVLRSAAQALLSVSNNAHCSHMKKLVWTVRQRRSVSGNESHSAEITDRCVTCQAHPKNIHRMLGGKKRRRTCKVCFQYVCSSCKVKHTLHFMLPDRKLVRQDVTFCRNCVEEALSVKTLVVARDEIQFSDLYNWSDVYASSSGTELTVLDDLN